MAPLVFVGVVGVGFVVRFGVNWAVTVEYRKRRRREVEGGGGGKGNEA